MLINKVCDIKFLNYCDVVMLLVNNKVNQCVVLLSDLKAHSFTEIATEFNVTLVCYVTAISF